MAERRIAGVRPARGRYKPVCSEHYGSPKEAWRFRTARAFLAADTGLFHLQADPPP